MLHLNVQAIARPSEGNRDGRPVDIQKRLDAPPKNCRRISDTVKRSKKFKIFDKKEKFSLPALYMQAPAVAYACRPAPSPALVALPVPFIAFVHF